MFEIGFIHWSGCKNANARVLMSRQSCQRSLHALEERRVTQHAKIAMEARGLRKRADAFGLADDRFQRQAGTGRTGRDVHDSGEVHQRQLHADRGSAIRRHATHQRESASQCRPSAGNRRRAADSGCRKRRSLLTRRVVRRAVCHRPAERTTFTFRVGLLGVTAP